jgi:cysteinyl-tRNA synthetase
MEVFKPREGSSQVKMFTCGPSIYNWPHIGNYRTFLFEDILQRYLEFRGYAVDRLINFTDVEDKAVARANQEGLPLEELTQPVADRFFKDCALLNINLPHPVARSSTSVDQAVYLIEQLLEKQIAYRHGGDVFYDPTKFKEFGKLYRLDMSRWPKKKIRFYKDTYPGQRWNLGDFILWKSWRQSDGNVYWETSLGKGRPAWNVQDPAMITKHLGHALDICCGGVDNLVRHHDYNIAVIEGVYGKELAKYWLHGQHVLIEGAKMSKSRGNIVYVQDLLNLGYQPHHIRFFLIYGNYRSKLNLTDDHLHLARGKVDTFREMVSRLRHPDAARGRSNKDSEKLMDHLQIDFEDRLNDNLDVRGAFDGLYDKVYHLVRMDLDGRLGAPERDQAIEKLHYMDTVLKILD